MEQVRCEELPSHPLLRNCSLCLHFQVTAFNTTAALVPTQHPILQCVDSLLLRFPAVGGIIVGLVMKHAGGVRKGFSILAGILLTGYLDVVVAENPLTWPKLVSLPIVLLASYLHIIFPVSQRDVAVRSSMLVRFPKECHTSFLRFFSPSKYKAPREEIKAKKE